MIIILLIRQNKIAARKISSREENDEETKNQDTNDRNVTESGVYTELDDNRKPDNTYMSLVSHEKPCGSSGPSYSTENYSSHVTTPQTFRAPKGFSSVIPSPNHEYEMP